MCPVFKFRFNWNLEVWGLVEGKAHNKLTPQETTSTGIRTGVTEVGGELIYCAKNAPLLRKAIHCR